MVGTTSSNGWKICGHFSRPWNANRLFLGAPLTASNEVVVKIIPVRFALAPNQ